MSTLAEIEAAIERLPSQEQDVVYLSRGADEKAT